MESALHLAGLTGLEDIFLSLEFEKASLQVPESGRASCAMCLLCAELRLCLADNQGGYGGSSNYSMSRSNLAVCRLEPTCYVGCSSMLPEGLTCVASSLLWESEQLVAHLLQLQDAGESFLLH